MLPKRIDKYELLELIAVGGQAEVYRGRLLGAKEYSKTVAIKKILSNVGLNSDLLKLFEREARMCALLDHPNVIHTFDFLQESSDFYMVMEFIHGKNLLQLDELARQKGEPLSLETCVFIISQACLGLDYAHQKSDELGNPLNIIHRDISPHNIMITYDGTVKVVDFGVAKVTDGIQKTATGMLMGKLAYMSAEQANCQPLDCRTDIFSLGLSLYEILTGSRTYDAPNEIGLLDAARNCVIAPPSARAPNIPSLVDQIVMKSLEKQRENRYVSAHEMAEDLLNFLSQHSPYSSIDLGFLMKSLCEEDIQKEMLKVKSLTPAKLAVAPSSSPPTIRSNEFNSPVNTQTERWNSLAPILLSVCAVFLIAGAFWLKKSPAPAATPSPDREASQIAKIEPKREAAASSENPAPTLSPEQINQIHLRNFNGMTELVWNQTPLEGHSFHPSSTEVLEFVIARWKSSTSGKYALDIKDSSPPPVNAFQQIHCRTSSRGGCGPLKVIGRAPFTLEITPIKTSQPEFYINEEDCKNMGQNTALTEKGGCKFELPAGKQSIPIHLTFFKK